MGRLKSKTYWFAIALNIFGAVQLNWGLITPFISPRLAGFGLMAIGIAVAVLREVTTEPLSDK